MGILIKTIDVDGEKRVPPNCMKLLLDLAGHRDLCDQCFKAYHHKTTNYCITGIMILQDLCKEPEVSQCD